MNYIELAKSLADQIPDNKMYYIVSYLQGAAGHCTILIPAPLPIKNKDHSLSGNYSGYVKCHIKPDWLLIYKQTDDELRLDRTGTHAALTGM